MIDITPLDGGGFEAARFRKGRFLWGWVCLALTIAWVSYFVTFFFYLNPPFGHVVMLCALGAVVFLIIVTGWVFDRSTWYFSPHWVWTSFERLRWDSAHEKVTRRLGPGALAWAQTWPIPGPTSLSLIGESQLPFSPKPRFFLALKFKIKIEDGEVDDFIKLFYVPGDEEEAKGVLEKLAECLVV